jgi:hypothetical protein
MYCKIRALLKKREKKRKENVEEEGRERKILYKKNCANFIQKEVK